MRHRIAGRKLGRTTEHRTALLRNLSTALFRNEKIKTTLAKAKELRPFAEKLVTISKKETLHARRQILRHIQDRAVVAKLVDSLSARYSQRPGGYTRIIKLGPRRGDNAEMAIIELVDAESASAPAEPRKPKRPKAASKSAAEDAADEKPAKKKATKKKTAKKKASSSAKPAARSKTAKQTKARMTKKS